MAQVNVIVFEGNLGKNPELKQSPQGNPYCVFTMAQTVKQKVRGEEKEITIWAEVTVFGKIAESLAKNLHKGRRVLVNGSFLIEDWTDRDGKNRYTLKIKAHEVNYLDEPSRRGTDASGVGEGAATTDYDANEEIPLKPVEEEQTPWR